MTDYQVARPGDEAEILDFANMVFSQAHRPHDFRALLPKMYARRQFAEYHVVARQNGKIVALVGVWPFRLRVLPGRSLNVGYVGTVSVHPYHRGEGHMRELMPLAVQRAREAGMDLMSLGGQRQRYRYFGFEQGGLSVGFDVIAANLRHDFAAADANAFTFAPLAEEDGSMAEARALHARELMTGERPGAAFAEALTSWLGEGVAVRRDGAFVGYLYAVDGDISEWVLTEPALIGPVLKAWMQKKNMNRLSIAAPAHEPDRIRALDAFAERCTIASAGMYRVLDWQRVLSLLMAFRQEKTGLAAGEADLAIRGEGVFHLSAGEGGVRVGRTGDANQNALTAVEAVGLVFSLPNRMGRREDAWHGWFPLPVSVPQADCF